MPYTAGNTLASAIWLSRIWLALGLPLACWPALLLARYYEVSDATYWKYASLALGVIFGGLTRYVLRRKAISNRCRILYFRSFDHRTERDSHRTVMPILGLYGDLITVAGPHLERSRTLPLMFTNEVITDEENRLHLDDGNWQARVRNEISAADVVVVDLSAPKRNVLWELSEALAMLPPYRVLLVCAIDRDPKPVLPDVDVALRNYASALGSGQHHVIAYGGSLAGNIKFAWSIQQLMRRIRYQRWGGVDIANVGLQQSPADDNMSRRG